MDKANVLKKLLKQIATQKAKDYTSATIFFLVFSILVFFAIRPSLVTAFSLKKEEQDLRALDAKYEGIIVRILSVQSSFELLRDELPLFSEAIPETPKVNKLIKDIEETARANSVAIQKSSAGEVKLVEKKNKKLKSVIVNVDAVSSFENILQSLEDMANQRRLKYVKTLEISRDEKDSTVGGELNIRMEVEGYHL
ncbi:type 4a pilus biogenesis protein PilO [Candidatus Roizmanbacteria bacterium]|nr:type 4a pilus biogenesis protein PilO [Candidatus Roizmanbacteria bacterium]